MIKIIESFIGGIIIGYTGIHFVAFIWPLPLYVILTIFCAYFVFKALDNLFEFFTDTDYEWEHEDKSSSV